MRHKQSRSNGSTVAQLQQQAAATHGRSCSSAHLPGLVFGRLPRLLGGILHSRYKRDAGVLGSGAGRNVRLAAFCTHETTAEPSGGAGAHDLFTTSCTPGTTREEGRMPADDSPAGGQLSAARRETAQQGPWRPPAAPAARPRRCHVPHPHLGLVPGLLRGGGH